MCRLRETGYRKIVTINLHYPANVRGGNLTMILHVSQFSQNFRFTQWRMTEGPSIYKSIHSWLPLYCQWYKVQLTKDSQALVLLGQVWLLSLVKYKYSANLLQPAHSTSYSFKVTHMACPVFGAPLQLQAQIVLAAWWQLRMLCW